MPEARQQRCACGKGQGGHKAPGPGGRPLASKKSNSATEREEQGFRNVFTDPTLLQLKSAGKNADTVFLSSLPGLVFSPSPSDFILEHCLVIK